LLAERDVYVPGKDPAANLIAHLLRDARFGRAAGRGMYGLAGWPIVRAAISSRRVTRKPTSRATRASRTSARKARAND
jgi:hypothetical protein